MSTKYFVKAADGRTTSTRSSKKLALDWFQTDRDAIWIETDKGTVVHGTRPVEFEPEVDETVEAETVTPVKIAKPRSSKALEVVDGKRHCNFCGETKAAELFYTHKTRCKACYKDYADTYFAAKKAAAGGETDAA
jgi:hypothetical protein